VRIALGQFNPTVGDLSGNVAKMKEMWARAVESGADLVLFPELAICGYPPEDLVYKRHFVEDNRSAVEDLAAACPEKTVVAGFVESDGRDAFNTAAVLQEGRIVHTYHKCALPNYSVFDEQRYFKPGTRPLVININGLNIALTICFDIWNTAWLSDSLTNVGQIHLVLNLSASPFHMGKIYRRNEVITACARTFNSAVAYCNLVGGQDELVFDGRSILADSAGNVVTKAKAFEEDLLIADIEATGAGVNVAPLEPPAPQPEDALDEVYQALVLGTRDYTRKNGFQKVLLGISGGIDSALTAAIAAAGTDIDVDVFESFKGRIDDVRIYSYALSEPEIQYLVADLQAPDDASLVAHWAFEGDFTDATGKGHDGLAFGDPTIVNDPLRGQVLEVDGDDRVGVSDAPDLNYGAGESLTLTAWANFGSAGAPEGWKAVVAKGRTELGGGTGYVPEFYGFYVSPSNNWHVNAGGIGGDAHAAAGGQWHHLAFVQDGSAGEGYFYIDGEVVISGGADSCDTTGRPLFIGAAGTDIDVDVFESFKGRIDDVRIYSYALSEPEIQHLVLAN